MIRIIVHAADFGGAAHFGSPVVHVHKTFDVDLPAVESFLRSHNGQWETANVAGVELLSEAAGDE